ncbi:MAG: hypothetical protein ACI8QC_002006, partial [Planctomycetota bacterium]
MRDQERARMQANTPIEEGRPWSVAQVPEQGPAQS